MSDNKQELPDVSQDPSVFRRIWLLPTVVAFLAGFAVISSIDASGDYPSLRQGPGLTIDEVFNVEEGTRLASGLQAWLHGYISTKQLFGERSDLGANAVLGYHNPDHPPLGRLWIGIVHSIVTSMWPAEHHLPNHPFVTSAARVGSAIAFALTILLVGVYTSRWYGSIAGLTASLSLVLMPRLFGHAHLAALETIANLFVTATVLYVADKWTIADRISRKHAAIAGLLFGLALLTKIQAVLIPIPLAIWAIWKLRQRAIVPLIIFGVVSFAIFFAGWPWLWIDPVAHLFEYFGRTAVRTTLYVWYFGEKLADRAVPWHYSWVMFLLTVPAGLHMLGALGLVRQEAEQDPRWRERLLLLCTIFPLAVFSIPGVPVYDGTRLFLIVFPLWAIIVGRGGKCAYDWLRDHRSAWAASAIFGLYLSLHGAGLFAISPCYLSYYNVFIGGLPGAERLGLETTYWGDSITREFLQDVVNSVPQGTLIEVSPQIHQFYFDELLNQSPILREHGIRLRPFDPEPATPKVYRIIFFRKADLPDFLRTIPPDAKVLAVTRRQGVTLAVCYQTNAPD